MLANKATAKHLQEIVDLTRQIERMGTLRLTLVHNGSVCLDCRAKVGDYEVGKELNISESESPSKDLAKILRELREAVDRRNPDPLSRIVVGC